MSKRYRDLAEGKPCMIRIPGVCNGRTDTTVGAHANWLFTGKGVGLKAPDYAMAWACFNCHTAIDTKRWKKETFTRDECENYWLRGFFRTIEYLLRHDLLSVLDTCRNDM